MSTFPNCSSSEVSVVGCVVPDCVVPDCIVAELILKPVIYYFHERIWYRKIKFGLVEEKKSKLKKFN